jgi:hypothetical protein
VELDLPQIAAFETVAEELHLGIGPSRPGRGGLKPRLWTWSGWTRRHQARARWFHQRTRISRDASITLNALVI